MTATPVLATVSIAGTVLGAGDLVSHNQPFGWLGVILLSLTSAAALWRAGSVKAWRETATAREERILDLERRLAAVQAELAIPERIEGIVRFMAETAEHQEQAASRRVEEAIRAIDKSGEDRTKRIIAAIERRPGW